MQPGPPRLCVWGPRPSTLDRRTAAADSLPDPSQFAGTATRAALGRQQTVSAQERTKPNGSARGRQGPGVEPRAGLPAAGQENAMRAYDGLGSSTSSENGSPGPTEASAARIVSAGMPATSGLSVLRQRRLPGRFTM
jgi:hypothetical protein